MAFNYSPKTTTNGLILYFDAANTKSYVSGSAIWNDLSRSGGNGTILNGPVFNSANGGSIFFDGVNEYVTTNISLSAQNTVSFWLRPDSGSTANGIFDAYSAAGTSGVLIRRATSGTTTVFVADGSSQAGATVNTPSNSWTNLTLVNDGINARVYVNMGTPSTIARVHAVGQPILLATRQRGGVNYWSGNIANIQVYNRALTLLEMTQNYNTTKTRFGL
jgi:hypothetical protein